MMASGNGENDDLNNATNDDGDDAVISFFADDDDDDDEMADLFSFGVSSSPSAATSGQQTASTSFNHDIDYNAVMASVMPLPPQKEHRQNDDDDSSSSSKDSEDSLLELLEQNKDEITVFDAAEYAANKKQKKKQNRQRSGGNDKDLKNNDPTTTDGAEEDDDEKKTMDEKDIQEILDWLDTDHDGDNQEEELHFVEPPKPPSLEETLRKANMAKKNKEEDTKAEPPPPEFKTLESAVKSSKSTMSQIRLLLEKDQFVVKPSIRPHLWCRVVCGKTLEETLQSSVADSFQHWEQTEYPQELQLSKSSRRLKRHLEWIQNESSTLAAERISPVLKSDTELCQRALAAVLTNHYCTARPKHDEDENDSNEKKGDKNDSEKKNDADFVDDEQQQDEELYMDTLLPPVACVLLSAGISKVGTAVLLNQILPKYMPILALTTRERTIAASALHQQFYLLACYHLPLLAIHLDRYMPDWYQGSPSGYIPKSYLISHLAGECGKKSELNPRSLLCLWDLILTSSNNSLRYFLALSILESHSDQLLLLTGSDLKDEIQRVMTFQDYTSEDGFAISDGGDDKLSPNHAVQWVQDWTEKAQTLWENTPKSVIQMLKRLEDDAVKDALTKRQRDAEERLKLKLEAQARAHQEAAKAEQERKEDAARLRLTRARLVAYYRQYNPGKENNIDKIMTTYEGRYDVLDAKLKQKYGVGFNPALKPKSATAASSTTASSTKPLFTVRRVQQQNDEMKTRKEAEAAEEPKKPRDMAVLIRASELIPSICWSKEANIAKLEKLRQRKKASKIAQPEHMKLPLKFYIVDCRPESSVLDQGRFPTSVNLFPEILLDIDRMKQMEDIFEGLRGTAHICIMGEGYSALPALYGHKITRGLLEFIKQDEARVMNCVLFFLKKGYPFVSVLDGGFAAAHAFLFRDGSKVHLCAQNVLTDYNPDVSIFGQFERAHNSSSGTEKVQRSLQNMFDSGLTALTKNAMRFESSIAAETTPTSGQQEERQQKSGKTNVVSRFFGHNNEASKKEDTKNSDGNYSKRRNSGTAKTAPSSNRQQKPKESLPKTEQTKSNPLSGLGAALNNSLNKTGAKKNPSNNPDINAGNNNQSVLQRNPFARFGMGSNNNNNNNPTASKKNDGGGTGGMTNKFAGLNQFRKNTMSRMRVGGGGAASKTGDDQAQSGQIAEDSTASLEQPPPSNASNVTAEDNDDGDGETEGSPKAETTPDSGDTSDNASPKDDNEEGLKKQAELTQV